VAEDRTGVVARLDALEAAWRAATPGPWAPATAPSEDSAETHAEYLTNALRPENGHPLWVAWAPADGDLHPGCDYVVPVVTGDGPTSEANARFVAAAHDAVPDFLAAVRGVLDLADEKTSRDFAHAWLRHQGYTDEWIAVGEQQTHQSAGCEFDTNCMTWMCCDSLDCSLHPEMDSVEEAGYFARFAVDFLAEQTRATVAAALGEA
jgi:hypothetical protein